MRTIPSDLLQKINEKMQTTGNNANPKMSIQVSRAKDTVSDSTYWTVETIRTKEGLGDLSVAARRLRPYGPPDRLYNIYVDNGVVKTAIREYPDYAKEKWKDQFELGAGSAVAIAFDCEWEFYRKRWRLVTYEAPFIFWVDDLGSLWFQRWDDTLTKYEMATGVNKVKAIRAWKNMNFVDQDQGVVAGYIKSDGKVYYRNYCGQADGSFVWETEKEITAFTGTATNLNMFITNDFRMGFVIEDSLGAITWIITVRDWAGMGLQPDKILSRIDASIEFIPVNYIRPRNDESITCTMDISIGDLLFGRTDNSLLSLMNAPNELDDWGWIIRFTIKYDSTTLPSVALTDLDSGQSIVVDHVEYDGGNVYSVYISNIVESGINNLLGDIGIVVTGMFNDAGYQYDAISQSFTPINLVPTEIPLPEVEVIWNE